jgi:hypothetical protein
MILLLRHGAEHLTERQLDRINTGLEAGDPNWELSITWWCYQQLRSAYAATNPATGKTIAERVLASFPTCPIPELARLGRTLRRGGSRCWPTSPPRAFQRRHRSDQPAHREDPPPRAWVQELHQLSAADHARRRRITPLPTATEPCLEPKSREWSRRNCAVQWLVQ